jgi:putative flippase GtrA
MRILNQFFKFLGVGVISTIVDWGIYSIMIAIGAPYLIALIPAYSSGAVVNFILNKNKTFQNKSKSVAQPLIFISIAAGMLLASGFILYYFVNILHYTYILSRIITTGIIFVCNFILHKFITFGLFKGVRE